MGRLIPAGTGLGAYKRLTVDVALTDDGEEADEADIGDSYLSSEHGHDVDTVEAAE
jgi:hypothetical protein